MTLLRRGANEETLSVQERSGEVIATAGEDLEVKESRPGSWEMLLGEARRLSSKFDEEARRVPRLELLDADV